MFKKPAKKGKKIISIGSDKEAESACISIDFNLPKKRKSGLFVQSDIKLEPKPEKPDGFCKKFVKSKSQIEKIRETQLEKHIEQTLNRTKPSQASDSDSSEENLYRIPEKYKLDNTRLTEGSEKTLWLSGLVEVPLSIEHTLDNIEATEAAKRKVMKIETEFSSRFDAIHREDYETFNDHLNQERNYEKEVERMEKRMTMKGKKYKLDKEQRIKHNEMLERSWQVHSPH